MEEDKKEIDINKRLAEKASIKFDLKLEDFCSVYSHDEALKLWYEFLEDDDATKRNEMGGVISFEEFKKEYNLFNSLWKANDEHLYELEEGIYVWIDYEGNWSIIVMNL